MREVEAGALIQLPPPSGAARVGRRWDASSSSSRPRLPSPLRPAVGILVESGAAEGDGDRVIVAGEEVASRRRLRSHSVSKRWRRKARDSPPPLTLCRRQPKKRIKEKRKL